MAENYLISDEQITIEDIGKILNNDQKIDLSEKTRENVIHCRNYLDQKLRSSEEPIYGINTGFGSLYNRRISFEKLEQLQENLVVSHACGAGEEIPQEIVRLMLFLKIRSLAYGKSGVSAELIDRLIEFYNLKINPIVYKFGSLGASGDLAPLAHLALPLIGKGMVNYNGKVLKGEELLAKTGQTPLRFKPKEGLALLNGTQFMSAYGVWCVTRAKQLLLKADSIAALSVDVFDGRIEAFDPVIHSVRPFVGQRMTAERICRWLKGSELIQQNKHHLQDPYSFRCIPQVHGASADVMTQTEKIFETEINSVTDNPLIFPDEDRIISGGNFHGQPLAMAFDSLCIAVAELGNISERRVYQLVSGQRNLPEFLVADPGLHSGLMIPQYTSASIVSRNKQLCTPASADSITSSNGQEDHVSMGANAAIKTMEIIENVELILAIELLTAVQALDFRRPAKTSPILEKLTAAFRKEIPFMDEDRVLHDDIVKSANFLRKYEFPKI